MCNRLGKTEIGKGLSAFSLLSSTVKVPTTAWGAAGLKPH
jgi:hypothetical protein